MDVAKQGNLSDAETKLPQAVGGSEAMPDSSADAVSSQELVIPLVAETARIEKKTVTHKIRVAKTVEEALQELNWTIGHDDVLIDRVQINKPVEAAVDMRYEGDTLIIPLYEEQAVVVKQLVLKEEVRIRKRRQEDPAHETVKVRRETIQVLDGDIPAESAETPTSGTPVANQ